MQQSMFNDWDKARTELDAKTCGARFSDDRLFRYLLWRYPKRPVNFLMLNPSVADETQDDPTIRRCRGYAAAWGFDGVIITNIFAYRATDPDVMKAAGDPVGPDNDAAIRLAASLAGLVVCAWGNHGEHRGRGAEVVALLKAAGVTPKCFSGLNSTGQPKHPLYLKADLKLQDMP